MESSSIESNKKSFKSAMADEADIIKKAIELHGIEHTQEPKFLDMVAALIHKRYLTKINPIDTNSSLSMSKLISYLVTGVFLISALASLGGMMGFNFKSMFSNEKKPSANGSIISGPFEFKTCNNLTRKQYFGQRKLFEEWKRLALTAIYDMNDKTKTREELEEQPIYIKLNFALFGEPGTGKTFFVQCLAREIDQELKKKYLKMQFKLKNKSLSELSTSELDKLMEATPSRVRFCEVQPGDVNSKYVGDSEQNIKLLFQTGRKVIDDDWKACVLFFDEGDVFFNQRSSGSDAGSSAATNVKSELLTKIGVMTSDKYVPLLVFTATNRMTDFDAAFKRRFANQFEFKILDYSERLEFIRSLLPEFQISEAELNLIANYTANKNQSYISEKVKLFIDDDYKLKKRRFRFRDYIDFLRQNADSINMI